jgi:hypothetical protein
LIRSKKRDKHINITDGSDGSCETVRQYQSYPVGSDSDDETKINKAENRALRKHNSKSKKAAVKPNNGSQNASSQKDGSCGRFTNAFSLTNDIGFLSMRLKYNFTLESSNIVL